MARNSQTAPSGCVVDNCIDQPYQDGYCYFHLRKLHPEAIGGAKPATKPIAPKPALAAARATSRTPVVIDTKPMRKPAPTVTRATRTSTPTTDLTELQRIERAGGRLTERQKRALRKAAREAQSNAKSPARSRETNQGAEITNHRRGVVATQRSVAGKGTTSAKPVVRTGKTTPPLDKVHAEQKRTRTRQAPSFYADKALKPATPEAKGLLAGPALTNAIRYVSTAMLKPRDESPVLRCMSVETTGGQLEITGTDRHRLHVVHMPSGKFKLASTAKAHIGAGVKAPAFNGFLVDLDDVKASIKSPLGSFEAWAAAVPHADAGSYPDWHRLINPNRDFREDEFVIAVGLNELRDALKPIVAFVKAAKAASESPVVLSWVKAKVGTSMHLGANITDQGDVSSEVVVNIVSGQPLRYSAVNAVYLADTIARMPGHTVTLKFMQTLSPVYLSAPDGVVEYEALIMPVNLGAAYELPSNVTGVAKQTVKTRKVEPVKVDGKAEMAAAEKRLTPEVKDDATAATKPARRSVRTRTKPATVKSATRGRRVPASSVQRSDDKHRDAGDRGSNVTRAARARKDNRPDNTASDAAPPASGAVDRRRTVDRGTAGVTRVGPASRKSAVTNLVKGWASQYEAKVDDKPTPTMRKRAETQITELVAAGHKVSSIVQAISQLFAQNRAIADLPKLIKEVA